MRSAPARAISCIDEPDELFDIGVARTRDGADHHCCRSPRKPPPKSRYLPADTPSAALPIVAPRSTDHEYDLEHRDGLFYIRTNKGATNFRVVTAPVGDAVGGALDGARRAPARREDRAASIRSPVTWCCRNGRTASSRSRSWTSPTGARHRVSSFPSRCMPRRPDRIMSSTRRRSATTISRSSRPARCSTTT